MIGYGVNTNGDSNQTTPAIMPPPPMAAAPLAPKKPMTLQEKQEAARKQDQELQQQQQQKQNVSRNDLFDLGFNSTQKQQQQSGIEQLMIEFPQMNTSSPVLNQSTPMSSMPARPQMTNNFMQTQFQQPQPQQQTFQPQPLIRPPPMGAVQRPLMNFQQPQQQSQQNLGFFGNLALTAPTAQPTQLPTQQTAAPMMQPLKPVAQPNAPKKSAFDDLADLLG